MRELEAIVRDLCARVPRAIGAIVCDWEGEAIACALGRIGVGKEAEERAKEHVPRAISLTMPVPEFLVRLAGAEPAGLLRMFGQSGQRLGTGEITSMEVAYRDIAILIDRLPNDFYLMMLLRRPAVTSTAKHYMDEASRLLAEHVA